MTRRVSAESFVLSPLTSKWTITDLLDWIGADDARCHDEALLPALMVLVDAVHPGAAIHGRTVAHVRWLAQRVAAHPALGELSLDILAPTLAGGASMPHPVLV